MQHLSRETLARYMIQTSSPAERRGVDWHLEYCSVCRAEFSVRDLLNIARDARDRMVLAVRSAERN